MAKKYNKTTFVLGAVIVALLALGLYFGGVFSIAVGVQSTSIYGDATTPSEALARCEQLRTQAQSKGQTCDPCGLACPSGSRTGTHTFSDGKTITFDPALCSTQYTALGNLLEAKSFCHDTIRLCEKQVGSGTVTSTQNVQNGRVLTITYNYNLVNCATGAIVSSSPETTTAYQLECNTGYYVDGTRTSTNRNSLGTCKLIPQETAVSEKKATLRSVTISDPATSGKSLRISGVADITGADGNYYLHAVLNQPPSNTFAIITGFGASDLCGNNPLAATIISSAKKDDQVVFSFDIVAPAISSGSSVSSGYTVFVYDRCGGSVLAKYDGQYKIQPAPQPTTTPINVPVGEELPYTDAAEITAVQAEAQGKACVFGDKAEIQGCVVAQCNSDGFMEALDPIICGGVPVASPSTTLDENGAVVVQDGLGNQLGSLWERFVSFIRRVFRIG